MKCLSRRGILPGKAGALSSANTGGGGPALCETRI